MLKLTLTFSELDLTETVKQNKAIYKKSQTQAVVASTKSKNNLLDAFKAENKIPQEVKEEEIFLDKALTEKAISEMVTSQLVTEKDGEKKKAQEEIAKLVISYMKDKLCGLCIYKKV